GAAVGAEALRRLREDRVAMGALGHRRLLPVSVAVAFLARPRPPHRQSRGASGSGQEGGEESVMPRVTVETVAPLARPAHPPPARLRDPRAGELDQVLARAASTRALDTGGAPPMSHAADAGRFREAGPQPSLPREAALAAAPDSDEGLFRVPRVIGG